MLPTIMRVCFMILVTCAAAPCVAQTVLANGLAIAPGAALDGLLEEAAAATVVHLTGGSAEEVEAFQAARLEVIRRLHESAGYDVLVMPVGIFEGWWVDKQLDEQDLPDTLAAWPLYRVWQESPAFRDLADYLHGMRAGGQGITIIGGLSRFHAIGKELYGPHLLGFFEFLGEANLSRPIRNDVQRLWAGRGRLARATSEFRAEALALAARVLEHIDARRGLLDVTAGRGRVDLERQFIANMDTFVRLEQLRAGDVAGQADGFAHREKAANLAWFLETRFPSRKLIVWEGLGDTVQGLEIDVPVFRIDLSIQQ